MLIKKNLIGSFLCLFVVTALCATAFAASEAESARDKKTGAITGRVMIKGAGPLAGGFVMLYDAKAGPPPMPEKYDRIPDISQVIDSDGRFRVELPPGKYYLGAVRRLSGERIGTLQTGDYIFRSLDEKGRPKEYLVKADTVIDAGAHLEAIPLPPRDASSHIATTAIEGIVVDMEGNPVGDAVVLAFVNQSFKGKPLFSSDKTGKDGKYTLRVSQGTYYLRVRNSFTVGPPEPGQIVGYFGEGTPIPVDVKDGEIKKGINFKVILFPGRGPFSGVGQ